MTEPEGAVVYDVGAGAAAGAAAASSAAAHVTAGGACLKEPAALTVSRTFNLNVILEFNEFVYIEIENLDRLYHNELDRFGHHNCAASVCCFPGPLPRVPPAGSPVEYTGDNLGIGICCILVASWLVAAENC